MKIGLINRSYSPDPAITAESAHAFVCRLQKVLPEADVTVYYVNTRYVGGVTSTEPVGRLAPISPIYQGRNSKVLRLLGSVGEGLRLAWLAARENDLVVSMTDPPLVNCWVGLLCRRMGIPWVYWALDLYPEAFVAAELVSAANPAYRVLDGGVRKNPPSFLVALGEQQAAFIQARLARKVPYAILPCGLQDVAVSRDSPAWKKPDGKIYFSYAGNLGEAHDAEFLEDFLSCLDPKRHVAVLSLYGAKAQSTLARVAENEAVRIVKSVSRGELAQIDVHLVSLLPRWSHVCVPSKGVSAVCAGSAMVFNGEPTTDTWQMLKGAGWLVSASNSRELRKRQIVELLSQITPEALAEKKANAIELKEKMLLQESAAYESLAAWISSLRPSESRSQPRRSSTPRTVLG